MSVINFNFPYVPDPNKGEPLVFCQLYIGEPDLDPEILANQKTLNVKQEDGTLVPVTQPFVFSAGGVPIYEGSTARLDVDGNYSLKILSSSGEQKYYVHNVFEGEPVTEESLNTTLQQKNYLGVKTLSEAIADLSAYSGAWVKISDRGFGLFQYKTGLTPNGSNIISADVAGLDLALFTNKNINSEQFSTGTAGSEANAAIASLHKSGDSDTGGIVNLSDESQALGETIVINNDIQTFSVDGIKLQGYGRQTSDFDATGLQDGVQMVFPIYTELRDFGISNASRYNIWIDDISSSSGNRNRIQGIKANFAGLNNFEFARSYLTTLESCEARGAVNNGFNWDKEVHTSWNIANNYAWYNTAAGFSIGRAVYSHLNCNASDYNQHGYQFSNSRGVVSTACGAEFNRRAGWVYYSGGTNTIRNHCVGTGLLANDNNTDNAGWANHTHLSSADEVQNKVFLNQPVSLASVDHQATTFDFEASGRGAVLVVSDPIMENQKTRARNGGYIQVNYSAPSIVNDKTFTATQTNKIIDVRSALDTNDYSGIIQITAHNSELGSTGVIGTATYVYLISQSLAGAEMIEITKAGLINGTNATHPSFVFQLLNEEISATAVSLTSGTFHFVIEKLSGSWSL